MAKNLYTYSIQQHEEWVKRLENIFDTSASINEYFRYRNTIIEVIVEMSDNCKLTLTLDFGRGEERQEHGCILCAYGTLSEIRKFIAHDVNGWDTAIETFKCVIQKLDYSSLEAVKKTFHELEQ